MSFDSHQLELTRPAWLAALAVLPVLVYYFYRSLVDLPRRQMLVSLLVRGVVILLLVLALAGLNLLSPTEQLFVVFAVDESLSVDDDARAKADEFIAAATTDVDPATYAVLPFAAEPEEIKRQGSKVEGREQGNASQESDNNKGVGSDNSQPSALNSQLSQATNIQAALEIAAAGMPPHHVPRIILLSDGNETAGDALRTAMNAEIPVSTVPLPVRDDPEIQVSAVEVPTQVAQGEPFYVEVVINSNHDDEVLIEVFKGDHRVISELESITEGENRFRFRQQCEKPEEFSVRLERPRDESGSPRMDRFDDTLLDNNMASGLVYASGKPRVLLVDSTPDLARDLAWALEEQELLVDVRPPQGLPESLADLQNYELIMLSNVPATDLTSRQMELVRTYVSDLGGGFIMLGGDQSFGLGGYYKSVIEEVLPVRSDFEKEKEKPSLAMVIVIDRSGSMGGQKIELAKEAAKSAVELLGSRDQIGVLAFDDETYEISELRPVADSGLVKDRISTIQAGGGTNMSPSMEQAYDILSAANAKLKHCIILTDGISAPGDFQGIAQAMTGARITVTTVGVGQGCDQALLEEIARIGRGRYYFTDDPSSIPQIFAKETVTASKSAINEEPFLPQVIRSAPALAEIDFDTAPFLLGFVITRPKPTSEVILATESGEPLLSWWRYGLGMSVAWTSDGKSRWAAEWLSWPGFNKFWAQVVRHAMRKSEAKGFVVDVQREGTRASVRVDSIDPLGAFLNEADATLTVIDPRLKKSEMTLTQTAPGRYTGEFEVADPGAYQIDIAQTRGSDVNYRQSRGLVVGYPDELRLKPTNEKLLRSLADVSGGTYEIASDQVFELSEETASNAVPVWPYLLAAALVLFLADVALRRIDFSMILPQKRLKLPSGGAPGRV